MLFMAFNRHSVVDRPAHRLLDSLQTIQGWSKPVVSPLDELIISTLRLDDYVNLVYNQNQHSIALYIGYYSQAGKVGAAHDPLVCFPGQGWILSQRKEGIIEVDVGEDTSTKVNYASMVGQSGSAKELIVYWFQAYDRTSPGTFWQKILLAWRRIRQKGSANAFVRITTPIDGQTTNEEHAAIENFIKAFYPTFYSHITKK